MYLVTARYREAGSDYFRSTVEPTWVKTKSGKTRLKFDLPENAQEYDNYNHTPQMPIYLEDLVQYHHREQVSRADGLSGREKVVEQRDKDEMEFLFYLVENHAVHQKVNYTDCRDFMGYGAKKIGDFLRDLHGRELIHREKVGRSSYFTATPKGLNRLRELQEIYSGTEEDDG